MPKPDPPYLQRDARRAQPVERLGGALPVGGLCSEARRLPLRRAALLVGGRAGAEGGRPAENEQFCSSLLHTQKALYTCFKQECLPGQRRRKHSPQSDSGS